MARFIDCQVSIMPWGTRVRFRRAKIGLLRKASTVYIVIHFSATDHCKFPIHHHYVQLMPAAIRFTDLQKDLFVRQVSDENKYATMLREINVIIRRDKLNQAGKGDILNRLIVSIPQLDTISPCELLPSRTTARLEADSTGFRRPPAPADKDKYHHSNSHNSLTPQQTTGGTNRHSLDPYDNENDEHQFGDVHMQCDQASREQRQRLENKQLRTVRISGLRQIPEQLWHKSCLNELTLTNCNLIHVPKQLELFSATLTSLDLSKNRIKKLPRTFCCRMNSLRLLDLSHNLVVTLPIEIKFLSKLIDFDISNNHLRMLPSTFSDLRNLRTLNLANNRLSQLPAFRREDIRLRELDVSYNPLDGAMNGTNRFEVYPSYDDNIDPDGLSGYNQDPMTVSSMFNQSKFPTLFETTLLKIVRQDYLFKLASQEALPRSIVSTMQREIFKCSKCNRMNILPAYNSTDILDYVDQVECLKSTGNYRHGMTFMKLLCRSCFDYMSS